MLAPPVVPPDAEARRILGKNLLDDARPHLILTSPLRLDDDPVFHARVHGSALLRFDLLNRGGARMALISSHRYAALAKRASRRS